VKFGYARVSTTDQSLDVQIDELTKWGVDRIFAEKASGRDTKNRAEFHKMMEFLREGDTVVVTKLDRLGRNFKQLVELMEHFKERNITFVSIKDGIDTSTITGKFMFNILAAVAEMERELILERTQAGREAARARGRLGGRPTKKTRFQIQRILEDYNNKDLTINEICEIHEISRGTLFRYVRLAKEGKIKASE